MKHRFLAASCLIFHIVAPGGVAAQDNDEPDDLDIITVTGSYIAGTPEDTALPVDVVTSTDLRIEGRPTVTELIRNLGVSSGADGQTNQGQSPSLEGTSNVNLRGLGAGRTLVLLNGRRQVFSPFPIRDQAQLFVDTNMIPAGAVERIEVLKDGAAALYGSDAIAGVVNFITDRHLDGFAVSGSYQTFEGSDGEYGLTASFGWQGDATSWVTTLEYEYQSETPLREKDWGILSQEENPTGGISGIPNPGRFLVLGDTGAVIGSVNDVGCEPLGAIVNAANGRCNFQFTQFTNLVEETERYRAYSEFHHELANGTEFFAEILYGQSSVDEWKTPPSYPPQILTNQFVPADSPGYQQYILDNPGTALDNGVGALFLGRTYGVGGFPLTGGAQEGIREYETWRVAGGAKGTFNDNVSWDTALAYQRSEGRSLTNDTFLEGLDAALSGFGVCTDPVTGFDPATGSKPTDPGYTGALVAGAGGCEYFNPFSNAVERNAVTGQVNPDFEPSVANSLAMADYLTGPRDVVNTTELAVLDFVTSGSVMTQVLSQPLGWAVGTQVRYESYEEDPNDIADLSITPGPDGTGPFSFQAGTSSSSENQTIYAAFAELQIPLHERLDIQAAARYENYGDDVGATFDPKLAGRLQISDAVVLRGSAQTSFKGPTLNQLSGTVTTLSFVAPANGFKAVDQFGNPDLDPERAFSFNFGAVAQAGGFLASLDYYNFDFSDPIIAEDQAPIVTAGLAALAQGDTDDPLLQRLTFSDPANPVAAEIARITTNIVNGPDIETSGVDLRIENTWSNDTLVGDITFGVDATYVFEYVVGNFAIEGTVIEGGDRVGQLNRSNFSRPIPDWKGNLYANYALGAHNLRGVLRHISSYDDERGDLTGNGSSEIDAQTTLDLFYNYRMDVFGLDLGLSVINVSDEDPPLTQSELNYDPYTHNPFGRTVRVSVTKTFN